MMDLMREMCFWIPINESPKDYEPVWSVLEKKTGRFVACNIEEPEAKLISNCRELLCDAMDVYLKIKEYNAKMKRLGVPSYFEGSEKLLEKRFREIMLDLDEPKKDV